MVAEPTGVDNGMKVLIRPLSGLANRLRAIASTLALFPEGSIYCYWSEDLFLGSVPPFSHPRILFIGREEFTAFISDTPELPEGLLVSPGVVALNAGFLGEQAYLSALMRAISNVQPQTIVLNAGGEFGTQTRHRRERSRASIYSEFNWRQAVLSQKEEIDLGTNYLGLHIRGKDLSMYLPSDQSVLDSLWLLSTRLETKEIFIAADSLEARVKWESLLLDAGFTVKSQKSLHLDRRTTQDLIASCVDFLSLSEATAMVYSDSSSFGHEASIQNTKSNLSIGLLPEKKRIRYLLNSSILVRQTRYLISRRLTRV